MQSVATILVLLAFSGSYITALAAVAWQVHHAAMSWSLLVLLQLTVLICLLSICASETNSLRDSRCFLLFCQAPTSSRSPCCCPIHAYIHTYIHAYIHTYMQKDFACMQYKERNHYFGHTESYMVSTPSLLVCGKKSSRAWWKSKKTTQLTHKCLLANNLPHIVCSVHTCIQHNLSIHNLLVLTLPHTTCSTPILHHLFSLSCFPHAIFTFLLLLVGRSWHVGLSGPLI